MLLKNRLETPDESSSSPERARLRLEVFKEFLKEGDVGAELGVFKGSFIDPLMSTLPSKLYVVDPWYRYCSKWSFAKGNPSTLEALLRILQVFSKEIEDKRIIPIIDFSQIFLSSLKDNSLDWIYIDSTHEYKQTALEIQLGIKKVKPGGIIMGDDYIDRPSHRHFGVWKAVNEAVGRNEIKLLVDGINFQFVSKVLK